METEAIGTRVNVLGSGKLSGTIAGYGVATRKGYDGKPETQTYCLVELDEGFWSERQNVFVSMLIVHPLSMEIAEGNNEG